MALIVRDFAGESGKKKKSGPPWNEKIIAIKNATNEPIWVRVRTTSHATAEVTQHHLWAESRRFRFAPGEHRFLAVDGKPISAVKACIRFDGEMTKQSNVAGKVPQATDWSLFPLKVMPDLFGPQQVVCAQPYDAPEMQQWLYTCRF